MNFVFMKIFNKKEARWYFYFGVGGFFTAIGGLFMIYNAAKIPRFTAEGLQYEMPFLPTFLFLFGIVTFLITKIYYEKTKVKK